MIPDLWLGLPSSNFESDTATFSLTSCLYSTQILRSNVSLIFLQVHLSILEQCIELSFVVTWLSLNHSEKTGKVLGLASSFLLSCFAVVHCLDALCVSGMITFHTSVVSEVAFTECWFLA